MSLTPQHHIIHKVSLDIQTKNEQQAFDIKDNISSFLKTEIFPEIERYFKEIEITTNNYAIRFEKLNIDVSSSETNLNSELKGDIIQQIKQQINEVVQKNDAVKKANGNTSPKQLQLKNNNHKTSKKIEKASYSEIIDDLFKPDDIHYKNTTPVSSPSFLTKETHQLETLLYFFEHGKAPWWQNDTSLTSLLNNEEVLISLFSEVTFKEKLLSLLYNSIIIERLINQLSSNILIEILLLFLDKIDSQSHQIIKEELHKIIQYFEFEIKKESFYNFFQKISSDDGISETKIITIIIDVINAKSNVQNSIFKEAIAFKNLKTFAKKIAILKKEGILFSEKGVLKKSNTHSKETNKEIRSKDLISPKKKKTTKEKDLKKSKNISLDNSLSDEFNLAKKASKNTSKKKNENSKNKHNQEKSLNKIEENLPFKNLKKSEGQHSKKERLKEKTTKKKSLKNIKKRAIKENSKEKIKLNKKVSKNFTSEKIITKNELDKNQKTTNNLKTDTLNFNKSTEDSSNASKEFFIDTKNELIESNNNLSFEEKLHQYSNSETELILQNAGLVLAHPFIPFLFKHCNLLDEDKNINNPELAVHILHYLATGKTEQAESDLLFEKFLCNIPFEQSINRFVNVSDEHKAHVYELLDAIKSNWSAMKTASYGLLQNEFLQRPGKISFKDLNATLTMEQKTPDILMNKLSWGFSMIRFSWKKGFIYVHWN
ncbi:contractile injection system tape measure protein [Tenacibaculum sp. M341]|uniref:contractile injection system tape measure protein n=1 Tax=Tenacibaculum sp. M341 TaxID=2530339 RepID=UPI00104D5605|nr:contractile injection system tape measure protein [Tenacibaculum sp. M341]TCI93199.1 hypothetical protein EYW44_06170 [Tenacibaculum sp. M341]